MNQGPPGAFPATRPSVIRDLGSVDPAARAAAYDALARSYWRPVYGYVRLRWRRSTEDAQDLTQEFFAQAFEREYLSRYGTPVHGRNASTFGQLQVGRCAANTPSGRGCLARTAARGLHHRDGVDIQHAPLRVIGPAPRHLTTTSTRWYAGVQRNRSSTDAPAADLSGRPFQSRSPRPLGSHEIKPSTVASAKGLPPCRRAKGDLSPEPWRRGGCPRRQSIASSPSRTGLLREIAPICSEDICRGGMGPGLRVVDRELDRDVAITVTAGPRADAERLRTEGGRAPASTAGHRPLSRRGRFADGRVFTVMCCCAANGSTARCGTAARDRLASSIALRHRWRFAHARGLIHRDSQARRTS